jgi:hypothetical protein
LSEYKFIIDVKLIALDGQKEQIDANSRSIQDILKHTEESILDMRGTIEKEKFKHIKD